MSKRKEDKLNKSQLSTPHKKRIKENTKFTKRKKHFKSKINIRKYFLGFIFLILFNILDQAMYPSQFLGKINYYSYVTLKIKGIGNRNVFNNK